MNVAAKGHVLYCEDHDDTRFLMTIMLEQTGFKVTGAASGEECLERAGSGEHFDLYLLDYTFPDASGVTLSEILRERDATTPILFYSARAMPKEKEAAIRAGAKDYLVKPDDLFKVADRIEKLISESKKGGTA